MKGITKTLRLHAGYYTKQDVALMLGITSLTHLVQDGLIPKPTHQYGNGKVQLYYNREDVAAILLRTSAPAPQTKPELLSCMAMARRLDLTASTFTRLIRHGVPGPSHRHGKRSYYLESEVESIREAVESVAYFKVNQYDKYQKDGWYSIRAASEMIDIPEITLNYWYRRRGLPPPTHLVNGHKFYTFEEVMGLKTFMYDNGYRIGIRKKQCS